MTRATRGNKYTGKTSHLYLAFELGIEEWKLGFSTCDLGTRPRVRVMPARDLKRLMREIAAAKQWFGLSATSHGIESKERLGRHRFLRRR